jgi:hypothetical protein
MPMWRPRESVARSRGERRQVLPVDDDRALRWEQQSRNQVQERRLSAS